MKYTRTITALALVAAITASVFTVSGSAAGVKEQTSPRRTEVTAASWFNSAAAENGERVFSPDEPLLLKAGSALNLEANVSGGAKTLVFEYKPSNTRVADCVIKLKADDNDYVASLPLLWTDLKEIYNVDSYKNELYPKQVCIEEFITENLYDYGAQDKHTLTLDLTEGAHKLTVTPDNQDLYIKSITLVSKTEPISYGEYAASHKDAAESNGLYVAEGEKYSAKSDAYIRSSAVKNAVLKPYSTYTKKINVLDGSTWSSVGQTVAWEINVKETGLYKLGMRYSLTGNAGKASYRSLKIDGALPFAECASLAVTGSGNGYGNFVFSAENGTPYEFYLTKGTHLISMRVEMGALNNAYNEIKALMQEINEIGTMLQKLTAGTTDENRTWDMNEYMPGTVDSLKDFAKRARAIYAELKAMDKTGAAYASNLVYAAESLEKLAAKPEQIPNRTNLLSIGDNSASKYLGVVLSGLTSHPITVDRIYVFAGCELPAAKAGFLKSTAEGFKTFFNSFKTNADSGDYSASYKKSKELQVWINKPVQYVQVLQQLLDETYNAENKTNIRLSIMPSEQKLILANASGTNPDLALSVAYSTPYNFAIRGAAENLLNFDDFLSFYSGEYNLEALVPLCTDKGVYGAIESQDFYVMFYRKDTLAALGLNVPDTWDDVQRMMPELLRYSMNFCVPIASAGGSKGFNVTAPFIYQNNGEIYSEDGMQVEYNSTNSLKGFTQMTELFKIYGAQQTVADFYNSFRYNTTPIGIGTFSNYIQFTVAAPELAGQWGIAVVPGVKQEDGSVLRYQMADSTASMIFSNSGKKQEAWSFLKWYLSSETQLDYANNLQMTYGTEYRLNTANLKAFSSIQYSDEDRSTILDQWKWQKETARHPASYMSERELSNAWINVVVNGDGTAEAIDKAVLQSNREIIRKMQEFGYCDENGKIIKEYRRLTAKDLYAMFEKKGATQ